MLSSRRVTGLMLLASLVLMLPAFLLGAGGADLHAQSLFFGEFSRQFFAGDGYPRWLADLFAGSGSPTFFYYPPLTYYAALPFHMLAARDPFGYYPIAASMVAALWFSALAFRAWMREEGAGEAASVMGSLLYLLLPNHLAYNFYAWLMPSSVWAYVFMPPMMQFAARLARGQKYGYAGYALALAGMLLTHLPSAMIMGPLSMVYALLQLPREGAGLRMARLTGSILHGFALAAVFLLPCFAYLDFVSGGLGFYAAGSDADFGRSQFFFGYENPASLGYSAYWLASFTVLLVSLRYRAWLRHAGFFYGASALCLFLMLPASEFAWNLLPMLRWIQIAERLFMPLVLLQAAMLTLLWPRVRWLGGLCLAASLAALVALAVHSRTTPAEFKASEPARFENYEMKIEQYVANLPDIAMIKRYGTPEGKAEVRADLGQVTLEKGEGTVRTVRWEPRQKSFAVAMKTRGVVRIHQFMYYGLQAHAGAVPLEITRDEVTGHARVALPPGNYTLHVDLVPLWPEIAGRGLSWLAGGALLLAMLLSLRATRSRKTGVKTG